MPATEFVKFLLSFFAILVGANLIVKSIDRFSHKLKLSSFAVSFFLLGILTSIPEFAVGLTAVSEGKPEIFAGNLIGGVAVIFFFIIPILAIFGNGIRLNTQLNNKNLIFSFLAMMAPLFVIYDMRITNVEGILLIFAYLFLFYLIEKDKGVFDGKNTQILNTHSYSFTDILKILLGVGLVFVSSNIIVQETIVFAQKLNVSTFYISLIALSIGTNLPEISLAVRSIISRKKDIAFGDYIGSAAANTFLFGLFTLITKGEVVTSTNFIKTFLLIGFGLLMFYYFTRSKRDISRKEGMMLLAFYAVFIIVEGL